MMKLKLVLGAFLFCLLLWWISRAVLVEEERAPLPPFLEPLLRNATRSDAQWFVELAAENRLRVERQLESRRDAVVAFNASVAVDAQQRLDAALEQRKPRNASLQCIHGFCNRHAAVDVCNDLFYAGDLNDHSDDHCVIAFNELRRRLEQTQFSVDCRDLSMLQFRTGERAGLGHELFSAARELCAASAVGAAWLPLHDALDTWTAGSEAICSDQTNGFACFFEPLARCEAPRHVPSSCAANGGGCLRGFDPRHFRHDFSFSATFSTIAQFAAALDFFWRRLAPAPRALIHRVERGLALFSSSAPPVIGIHFRSTDACSGGDGRVCQATLDEHLSAARRLASARRIASPVRIFLATDNQSMADACTRNDFQGFACATAPFDRRRLDPRRYNQTKVERARHGDASWPTAAFALTTIVDIDLLSRCDALVGSFTSTIDRVAYGLGIARHGGRLWPYASLEDPSKADYHIFSRYFT